MSQSVLRVDPDPENGARDPVTEPLGSTLVLSRPLGTATWLGRLDDTLVAARPVADRVTDRTTNGVSGPSLEAVSDSRPYVPEPRNIVAYYGVRLVDGAAWSVSEYVPGVSLDRLLRIAILTPAQAAHVACSIFTGLADLHDAGLVHGSLEARKVMIAPDGRVRLSGWAVSGRRDERARTADLGAACAIVSELVRNADRPVGRHHPGTNGLLVHLERLAAGGTPADARSAATDLADALTDAKGVRVGAAILDAQLAALTEASVRHAPQPAEAPRAGRAAQLSAATWGPRRRRRRALLVALGVVLIAAGLGYTTERGPITSLLDRVLHRTPASSAAQSPGSHTGGHQHLHAVPAFGPRSAHAVRSVVLHHPSACRTGHACAVRLHIRLAAAPHPHPRRIAWHIVTVNRCTGEHRVRLRGSLLVPAGHHAATVTRRLLLHSGAAAAVAVTTRPARAASKPMLVPPRHASC